jgi:protein-S-isoprenylcysteine O-methyltransferase Ste14
MTTQFNNEQSFAQKNLIAPVMTVICLAAMLLLNWLWPLVPVLRYPLNLCGFFLVGVGLVISFGAKYQFDKIDANFYPFRDPSDLVTDGFFRYSRNPMYLGLTLFLTGAGMFLGSLSPLVIASVFFLISDRWYIPHEEQRLSNIFGPDYATYQAGTPRWL